jgi:tetratricopeptide (TPR) repeat protein
MLFESFMQGAKDAKTKEEMYRMLDLAGGIAPALEDTELAADYKTAILLYRKVIETSTEPAEKAEAYYLLAKAYDISGDPDASIETLKELGRLYPGTAFYTEAQFRLGERWFSDGEFDLAIGAYAEVVQAGEASPFLDQAIYKRGWSYYKVSDFEKGLVDFFTLIDRIEARLAAAPAPAPAAAPGADGQPVVATDKDAERTNRLLDDTLRVASMSFNNLDGVKSVTTWFKKRGARPYEFKVYRSLGEVYLRQDRYLDASEAFEAYVGLYPDSDLAPKFSSDAIKALQDGGFPSQVLPAKEKFVKSYGIASKYWAQHEKQRGEYLPLLKSHLLDVAKHYHAQAQKANQPATFLVAARWYRELLQTDASDPNAATVNHLFAEALFSGEDFAGAIREFERTGYDYAGYEKASEAAYFGLVSYQALGDQIKDNPAREAESKALLPKKIAAGLRFAQAYPGHEKSAKVLQSIIEDQLLAKDVAAAVKTAGLLVSLQPPPDNELLKYGWQTIANGEFDLQRYAVAEFAYVKYLSFTDLKAEERKTYTERLAASVYKQGEVLVAEGKELEGAAQFMRVGQVVPGSTIRANAEFDAAAIYLRKEQYAQAIPVLENFRTSFPKHELLVDIPAKLAIAYEKTGNFASAAREMEAIHNLNLKSDPAVARVALWQAAELTEKTGDEANTVRLYLLYIQENPQPLAPRMEAQYKLVQVYEKRGDLKSRDTLLTALANGARSAGEAATPRTNFLGAYALFTLAEPVFQRFTDYKLRAPLKTSLAEKRKLMQSALDAYSNTAKFGAAEYVSAAQYRTAEVYRILAADLMSSERPRGLDELALEQYDLLLEEQALPFEDQAITLYTKNTELLKQDIYDEWVKKSFSALAILQPGRYGKKEQIEEYVDVIY